MGGRDGVYLQGRVWGGSRNDAIVLGENRDTCVARIPEKEGTRGATK